MAANTGKAPNRLDLLGRERKPHEVAHRLLETGEDEVAASLGELPHEELESRPALVHPVGGVARHHRQLVQVGQWAEGLGIGPE